MNLYCVLCATWNEVCGLGGLLVFLEENVEDHWDDLVILQKTRMQSSG